MAALDMRDYFAAQALQGMLASGMTLDIDGDAIGAKRVGLAYALADTMIIERAK